MDVVVLIPLSYFCTVFRLRANFCRRHCWDKITVGRGSEDDRHGAKTQRKHDTHDSDTQDSVCVQCTHSLCAKIPRDEPRPSSLLPTTDNINKQQQQHPPTPCLPSIFIDRSDSTKQHCIALPCLALAVNNIKHNLNKQINKLKKRSRQSNELGRRHFATSRTNHKQCIGVCGFRRSQSLDAPSVLHSNGWTQ